MHAPGATPVTVMPVAALPAAAVHKLGVVDLITTGSPEGEVAVTVPVPPLVRLGAVPHVMDWFCSEGVGVMVLVFNVLMALLVPQLPPALVHMPIHVSLEDERLKVLVEMPIAPISTNTWT